MRYRNLDLFLLEPRGERYPVLGLAEVGARKQEAKGELVLDGAQAEALADAQQRIEARETDGAFLRSTGARLFELLFRGTCAPLGTLLERTRGGAAATDAHVRLRLRVEPPKLAALPWELLSVPGSGELLATSIETALVRYVQLERPTGLVPTRPPVSVLVAIPNAPDLAVEREAAVLREAFAKMEDVVAPTFLEQPVTVEALRRALAERQYHVFHFVGHGEFADGAAGLRVDAPGGGGEWLDATRLAGLFQNQPTLKLAVLNACKGARVSETLPLVGLAPQLVRARFPAVVAMQYAIYDRTALTFAREFYFWLVKSWARGQVEIAVSQARSQLAVEFPDERAFAAPVLYLHADEGMLFDVSGGSLADVPIRPRDRDRHDALDRTRVRDIALLEATVASGDDPDAARALAEERDALRALRKRALLARGVVLVGAGTAALLFFLTWLGVFGALQLTPFAQSIQVRLASAFTEARPLDDSIAIVVADEETAAALGADEAVGETWRPRHGQLLDVLSEAGARTVVFTIAFSGPFESPDDGAPDDDEFAAAIRRARSRGTAVVVPVSTVENGAPKMSPKLLEALVEAAPGAARGTWALGCRGGSWGAVWNVPVAVAPGGDGARTPRLGLALAAVAASLDAEAVEIDSAEREVVLNTPGEAAHRVAYGHEELLTRSPGCDALAPGDRVASLVFSPSATDLLRAKGARMPYEDVLSARCGEDAPGAPCMALRDRLVFVGSGTKMAEIGANGPSELRGRHWVEYHADAADALLSGRGLRPLHPLPELFWMLVVAALAAAIRLVLPRERRLVRWIGFAATALLIVVVAVWLAAAHNILVGVVNQLSALAIAGWAAGWYDARTRRAHPESEAA